MEVAAKIIGDTLILGVQSGPGIDQKQQQVGLCDRGLSLAGGEL